MRGFPLGAGLLLAGALAAGCASPAARFDARAAALALERGVVPGDGFIHVVYRRPTAAASRLLHLYLDGDGRPWDGRLAAADPTPQELLTLRLLARDSAAAVYLGRPCYHGMAEASRCA